ncbi:3-hydroxyacyl-CoA dehydrogenase NAD-binding domain-containing protein [Azospirillum halopraeferens]|uniref:3-hydroxyacyl-CoA dehydrogenase NAD-binding domain-containing protein n=1 Tax=Azospirillum halopraeferens TaxID=34010 RepID=UPI0004251BA6|nr:3-hydroxyacyl-CoA dehydrogenase NAD-binding domain-containing protein [Azospirillum halopraeferens]
MTEHAVTLRMDGAVAVLTLDNPPVNALSHRLRVALADHLDRAGADAAVAAVVIAGAGRCLCAGGDLKEFGKPQDPPRTTDLLRRIEGFAKPVIAVVHGQTLGGGLELALACHGRVAASAARVGLPEVKLGLIPGAGGTQRLPRIIGAGPALDLIARARILSAAEALALGVVSEVAASAQDALAAGVALARSLAEAGARPVPPAERIAPDQRASFDATAEALLRRAGASEAVRAAVASVGNAFDRPFAEALEEEQVLFQRLRAGPQSRALRHLFFAERAAAKVAGAEPGDSRPIRRAAVIGAGTMGGGIAMAFADAGIPVALLEESREALDRGLARIRRNYESAAARGRLSADEVERRLGLIAPGTGPEGVAAADLVIEAVFEDMAVKRTLFARLDAIAPPGAILATNTSSLDIDAMAAATSRPDAVLGMHFFSPANVMRLLEIVRGGATSPAVLASVTALAPRIGKIPVIVGNAPGFVGNRILWRRHAAAERLLQQGATPAAVDRALVGFGFPMGPFAMADLAGLDVSQRVRRARGIVLPIADLVTDRGWHGQKTGRGYHRYEDGSRTPVPDPEVEALVADFAREHGVPPRPLSDEDMVERLLFPMINEAARVLEDGIAARPGDIDVVYVHGYGFPAHRGGLMHHADAVGLRHIADRLRALAAECGDDSLLPAPLLARLAAADETFADRAVQSPQREEIAR